MKNDYFESVMARPERVYLNGQLLDFKIDYVMRRNYKAERLIADPDKPWVYHEEFDVLICPCDRELEVLVIEQVAELGVQDYFQEVYIWTKGHNVEAKKSLYGNVATRYEKERQGI